MNGWCVEIRQQGAAPGLINLAVPVIFGVTLLVIWESDHPGPQYSVDPAACRLP